MSRRVVITGMGAITPIGNDTRSMWQSIKDGVCGIDKITYFDTADYKVKLAGQVKDLDTDKYFEKRELKFNDKFSQFARICAKSAAEDARLDFAKEDMNRVGVIVGSGIGGIQTIETAQQNLEQKGPGRVSPFFIPMALVNLAAGNIAIDTGAKGVCYSCVTACAAGTNAIGESFHKIRDGYTDVMICGGSEAAITPLAIAGFQSMRALHTGDDKNRASIPFDRQRSGFVMGEGAGILILEELEHAQKRNAKIYAEIVGYGSTCDAFHITSPLEDGSGGAQAMTDALADAGLDYTQIDYINAHGTSTPLNDKTETAAIKLAFKEHAYSLCVSSTKSYMGHLLGASGAVEAIICAKALQEDLVPATINYSRPDENCDLDIVPNVCREKKLNYVMSNSLGFGGHNASIILKKWSE